jgi:hypothetical protein
MECAMESERSEHLMTALLLTAFVMFDDCSDDSEEEIVLRKVKELSAKQELPKIKNYAEITVQLYYYNIPTTFRVFRLTLTTYCRFAA